MYMKDKSHFNLLMYFVLCIIERPPISVFSYSCNLYLYLNLYVVFS